MRSLDEGLNLNQKWNGLFKNMDELTRQKTKRHHSTNLMSDIVSTTALEEAFRHVYKKRIDDSPNSDIWGFSLGWATERRQIQEQLLRGTYQLQPLDAFKTRHGRMTRWSSRDSVVLKGISLRLADILSATIDSRCYHLKDRGGLKAAVNKVAGHIGEYRFVLKSDVAKYYDSMEHDEVLRHCRSVIKDRKVLRIIAQYLNRVEVLDGEYSLIDQGIPKGCPLSPLLGALMLKSLDESLPSSCFYARYMDDWVILVKTRGQLRHVVKTMHRVMRNLKFKLALDKTYIGRICKGFDFLGYRFNHQGIVALAKQTIQNFIERMLKLYEQGADELRVQAYVRRWCGWCCSGL